MLSLTVTEMQNIVYFRSISLFENNFTKIHYKFDENTFLSREMVQIIIKITILAVLLLLPWQQCTNLKFATSFEDPSYHKHNPLFLT